MPSAGERSASSAGRTARSARRPAAAFPRSCTGSTAAGARRARCRRPPCDTGRSNTGCRGSRRLEAQASLERTVETGVRRGLCQSAANDSNRQDAKLAGKILAWVSGSSRRDEDPLVAEDAREQRQEQVLCAHHRAEKQLAFAALPQLVDRDAGDAGAFDPQSGGGEHIGGRVLGVKVEVRAIENAFGHLREPAEQ